MPGNDLSHWDSELAAQLYDNYNRRHDRYRAASAFLVEQSPLATSARVLDFGAGTGVTALAALAAMRSDGRMVCFEPAAAMRRVGETNVMDQRVRWVSTLDSSERFDCVLCSATIWQIEPFEDAIDQLANHVAPGGTLSFNIPGAYLGRPDEPGEGKDPYLVGLISELVDPGRRSSEKSMDLPDPDRVETLLEDRFENVRRWSQPTRLQQASFCDWMKLPIINQPFFDGVPFEDRVRKVDAAFERCDAQSWRWETWLGWTATAPIRQRRSITEA